MSEGRRRREREGREEGRDRGREKDRQREEEKQAERERKEEKEREIVRMEWEGNSDRKNTLIHSFFYTVIIFFNI